LNRHSWKKNNLLLVFIAAVFFTGCGKEPDKKDYVAKVNDSYLTRIELDRMTDTLYKNNFYRNELIRNWIDRELLFQQAVSEGIVEEEEFTRIIDESRKSLAAAMYLEKISEQYDFEYTDDDLEKFLDSNKDDFKLNHDTYFLNEAEFATEEDAFDFRTSVLQKDWLSTIESGKYNNFLKKESNFLLSEDEIYPLSVRNILEELYPLEVSIAINTDSSTFTIVQVIEKYPIGTIPPFNLIKKKVEERFISNEKRKYLNEYIKRLYSGNEIEVKSQDKK
jgi:hypothetical protein